MRVLVTGASGQVGPYAVEALRRAGREVVAWSGSAAGERAGVPLRPVDLTDPGAIDRALAESDPAAIVHAAAISTAEPVRLDPARARAVNVDATAILADWCARRARRFVFTSTDMVFGGDRAPYREDDQTAPIQGYGRTKVEAERAALSAPGAVVARLSLLFGPARGGRPTYLDLAFEALRRGERRGFFGDEHRTALDYETAGTILARLVESDPAGIVHVGGAERVSRFDLARRAAAAVGLDTTTLIADRRSDATFPEPRPADLSLDSGRLTAWFPDLDRPTIEAAARRLWGVA